METRAKQLMWDLKNITLSGAAHRAQGGGGGSARGGGGETDENNEKNLIRIRKTQFKETNKKQEQNIWLLRRHSGTVG